MTAPPTDDPRPGVAELRDAREALDAATGRLCELADEVAARRADVDDLEGLVDLLLDLSSTPVVVVDEGRHVTAISRAAVEVLDGAIGDPLAKVLPAEAARTVGELLEQGEPCDVDLPTAGEGARVRLLPGRRAVLVLPRP
jgi:hypothetical protein